MKFELICLFLLITKCLGANILVMSLLASPSHYYWHKTYSLELVRKGHNVTIVSQEEDKEKVKIQNFTTITLEGVIEKMHKAIQLDGMESLNPFETIQMLANWEVVCCRFNLETNGLKTLMNYPEDFKFDLIVWDISSGKCMYPLIDRFGNPPLLATSPFGNQPPVSHILGNRISAHVPFLTTYYSENMNFKERFLNFIYVHSFSFYLTYIENSLNEETARIFFKDDIASIDEYERRFTLMLVNSDPIFHYPEALYPNMIPVAGLHFKPVKALPQDIKTILDEATNGVIYVSFGTNLDFDKFEEDRKKAFLDAFRRLPQTVLLKSSQPIENAPKNVIFKKWLPQNDILAHPKIKLFITHGGSFSMQEIVYHGIPVIGIPFFLDQHQNMAKITHRKMGKMMVLKDITSKLVYDSITEILNNDIYATNMKRRSKKFSDQPQSPLERAMFWTEYMLRYGSAEELNSSTRDMNFIQFYELDIILTLFVSFILIIVISYGILKFVLKLLLRLLFSDSEKLKKN